MNLMQDRVGFVGESGLVKVDLEWMGEGWDGDYDENDPNDTPFLRFSVSKWDGKFWEAIDDSSYCTLLPATVSHDTAISVVKYIMSKVEHLVVSGLPIKKTCEQLSWIKPELFIEDEEDIS